MRYLNNQHIRKQKITDAELNYGSLSLDHTETMKEIGELGLEIWKRQARTFIKPKNWDNILIEKKFGFILRIR